MSRDHSLRAEQVLARVRASADPAFGLDERVLARVEQRLALETAGSDPAGSDPAGSDPAGNDPADTAAPAAVVGGGFAGSRAVRVSAAAAARAGSAARVVAPASRWGRMGHAAARMARWGVFGLVAGAIGYQLGVRQERTAHEASLAHEAHDARTTLPSASDDNVVELQATPPEAAPARAQPPTAVPSRAVPSRAVPSRAVPSRAVPPRARGHASGANVGAAPRASASSAAQPLSLAEILERLQRAQAALHAGDPHAALAQLDALDTLNALEHGGALADERRVLRALALCDLGRFADARHVLAELDGRGADSIYKGRLEQSCARALEP